MSMVNGKVEAARLEVEAARLEQRVCTLERAIAESLRVRRSCVLVPKQLIPRATT